MKVVILAGGFGTRLSEETEVRPKPLVEVGGRPIIWHIMKIFSAQGFEDFIVCLGYKGHLIREYFMNLHSNSSDIRINVETNEVSILDSRAPRWKVALVDTGINTLTGGRIRRVGHLLDEQTFLMTYGDGVGDVNLREELSFHHQHGRLATVAAVRPVGRFGVMDFGSDRVVTKYMEKPPGDGAWISGGFFVLNRGVLPYIRGDDTAWEVEPIDRLVEEGQLLAYTHRGFWRPMDTLTDKRTLDSLWESGSPPWKIWKD